MMANSKSNPSAFTEATPLDSRRDAFVCVCGTRFNTTDSNKHLFSCKTLQKACQQAKWPTLFRQLKKTNESEPGQLEQYAYPEFANRIRQFKETNLMPFCTRPNKHLKGLLSLDDFRSPLSFLDVYRCPDCAHTFLGLPTLVQHFMDTTHGLVQCAECDTLLWNWVSEDPNIAFNTPALHSKREKHVGIKPVVGCVPGSCVRYRDTIQYRATHDKSELLYLPEQYECSGCKRVFNQPLSMLHHLTMNPGCQPSDTRKWALTRPLHTVEVECNMCDTKGSPQKMHIHHLETLDFPTPHDSFYIPDEMELLSQFLVADPRGILLGTEEAAFQCQVCTLLFDTWIELQKHMVDQTHGVGICGASNNTRGPCDSQLGAPGSHPEHENQGKMMFNPCMVDMPHANEVVVNRSSIEFAHIGPGEVEHRTQANKMNRLVYQCSHPGCYAVFTHEDPLQEHLYIQTHGTWKCPEPMCRKEEGLHAWLRADGSQTRKCPHGIPNDHHLADKYHPGDFIVTMPCSILIEKFPTKFSMCKECGMAKDHFEDELHDMSGECLNYQKTGRVTRNVVSNLTIDPWGVTVVETEPKTIAGKPALTSTAAPRTVEHVEDPPTTPSEHVGGWIAYAGHCGEEEVSSPPLQKAAEPPESHQDKDAAAEEMVAQVTA